MTKTDLKSRLTESREGKEEKVGQWIVGHNRSSCELSNLSVQGPREIKTSVERTLA